MNLHSRSTTSLVIASVVVIYASGAFAHPGPRIWVNVEGSVIVTYAGPYPPGDPNDYELSTVFTQPLGDVGSDIWETEFPGYQQVPGGTIAAGTTFSYDITGPLLWYNDAGGSCALFEPVEDHFADSPPVPQMAVTNELFQTEVTAGGFVSGDAAFTYNGNAGDHNHLTYTLLGDGMLPGGGPDGIYALPLRLTAPGLTASQTFYLLLGKNASDSDFTSAAEAIANPPMPGDFDCDGDVDAADFAMFSQCFGGSLNPPAATCPPGVNADLDGDGDVDALDFVMFSQNFTGSL